VLECHTRVVPSCYPYLQSVTVVACLSRHVNMGAEQSSTRDNFHGQENVGTQHVKTCYYELLSVDRQASEDECGYHVFTGLDIS